MRCDSNLLSSGEVHSIETREDDVVSLRIPILASKEKDISAKVRADQMMTVIITVTQNSVIQQYPAFVVQQVCSLSTPFPHVGQ